MRAFLFFFSSVILSLKLVQSLSDTASESDDSVESILWTTLGRTDTMCTLPASAKTLTISMFLLVTKSKNLAMCVETSGLFFSPGYPDFVPNVHPGLPADTIPRTITTTMCCCMSSTATWLNAVRSNMMSFPPRYLVSESNVGPVLLSGSVSESVDLTAVVTSAPSRTDNVR